jgi:predicted Zn finger-like uncharacterized protein
MPIDTICPGCQAQLRIGDEFAGQHVRCPACDTIYTAYAAPASKLMPPSESAPQEFANESATAPVAAADPASPTAIAGGEDAAPAALDPTSQAELPPAELPPADGTKWYLRTPEGPVYGPVVEAAFARWVAEGRVTPDCLVCPGDNAWHAACEIFPSVKTPPSPQPMLQRATVEEFVAPHRGALVLILGIMGIITTCPIPSLMAWMMGTHDLEEMQAGRVDSSGQALTQAGRVLGMIFSILYIVGAVAALLFLVLVAAR